MGKAFGKVGGRGDGVRNKVGMGQEFRTRTGVQEKGSLLSPILRCTGEQLIGAQGQISRTSRACIGYAEAQQENPLAPPER